MKAKRPKQKVDGWVVLDKPLGMGSTTAVGRVRWLFSAETILVEKGILAAGEVDRRLG